MSLSLLHTDRPGNLMKLTDAFRDRHEIITAYQRRKEHAAEFIVAVDDLTPTTGFTPVLSLCRDLQKLECCSHIVAEFAKFGGVIKGHEGAPSLIALFPYGRAPFESFLSDHRIRRSDPLHPENADESRVNAIVNEMDRAAAEIVADPDHLFQMSPSDFERMVAEVYRAHGFDVRITAGPRDHGVDAIAVFAPVSLPKRFQQHFRVGIQVKRYRRDHKVEERELRDFFGAIVADEFDRGIFVTTSSLTAAAAEYVDVRRAVRDRVSIVSGEEVIELLVSYCKHRSVPFWNS